MGKRREESVYIRRKKEESKKRTSTVGGWVGGSTNVCDAFLFWFLSC